MKIRYRHRKFQADAGKDARRIYMKLSRRPIDIIAKTNPILIIDELQSVEGNQTKERLKDFFVSTVDFF